MRTGCMASAPRLMAAAMMLGIFRYDSELAGSPMHTASSASCTDAYNNHIQSRTKRKMSGTYEGVLLSCQERARR